MLCLTSLLAAACGGATPRPVSPAAERNASPPAAPSGPEVPTVPRGELEPLESTPLRVTTDAIAIGDGPAIVTLDDGWVREEDRVGGPGGLLIAPLRDGLDAAAPGEVTALAVHPDVPYGTVAAVVYTLGQTGRTRLALLARKGEALVSLPIVLPSLGELGRPTRDEGRVDDASLDLAIAITGAGIVVSGSGGALEPDCQTVSPRAMTLPLVDGAHDLEGLTRCLVAVKDVFVGEETVVVSAESGVRFGVVADAIAASRHTASGRPLFPVTLLSAEAGEPAVASGATNGDR